MVPTPSIVSHASDDCFTLLQSPPDSGHLFGNRNGREWAVSGTSALAA